MNPESAHPLMGMYGVKAPRWFGPITVPEDHFFMMGDNRDNSRDARFRGSVQRDQVVGRATRVVMSPDCDHWYTTRFERFFQALP